MKKQLHFLLAVSMLCTINLITAQENVNQVFTTAGDWAVDDKPNGTSAVSGGHMVVTMGDQGNGAYRADLKFLAGTNYTINSTVDKFLAVKFIGDRPATGALKVELYNVTSGAWMNNGGGKYNPAGSVVTAAGNNIYYFDFSTDVNYTAGDKEIDKINFTIADVVDATNYTIDWIATFTSVVDIEAYKEAKDDGPTDTEGTLGVNDFNIKNSSFKLYPNPSTNNSFSIELNKEAVNSNESINVYNLLGSLVLEKPVNNSANKIIVNHNLKTGIYLVKIGASSSRLIVK